MLEDTLEFSSLLDKFEFVQKNFLLRAPDCFDSENRILTTPSAAITIKHKNDIVVLSTTKE